MQLPNGIAIRRWSAGLLLALVLGGCETPGWGRLDELFSPQHSKITPADEERHRVEYIETRSQESIQWLLRHCVENGMSHEAVAKVLGEQGTREAQDAKFKAGGGTSVQIGDDLYAYGPDDHSRMYYLVFRDNVLVGFEPKDYTGGRSTKRREADDGDEGEGADQLPKKARRGR